MYAYLRVEMGKLGICTNERNREWNGSCSKVDISFVQHASHTQIWGVNCIQSSFLTWTIPPARRSYAVPGCSATFLVRSGEWAILRFKISLQKHIWVFRKCFTPCLLAMIQITFNRSEKVLGGRNPPLRISSVRAFMKDVIIKKWMNAFVSLWEFSEWLLFLSLFIPWRNWELIFAMPDWGY